MKPIIVNVPVDKESNQVTMDYEEFKSIIKSAYNCGKDDGATEALARQFITRNRKFESVYAEMMSTIDSDNSSNKSTKSDNCLSIYSGCTSMEKLNLYRNLYYTDGNNTEQGIIANAINEVFTSKSQS